MIAALKISVYENAGKRLHVYIHPELGFIILHFGPQKGGARGSKGTRGAKNTLQRVKK